MSKELQYLFNIYGFAIPFSTIVDENYNNIDGDITCGLCHIEDGYYKVPSSLKILSHWDIDSHMMICDFCWNLYVSNNPKHIMYYKLIQLVEKNIADLIVMYM